MQEIVAIPGPGKYLDAHGVEREFTADDLRATAEAYDPELHEAPIVIGHPKHDAPAYGWLKGAAVNGQGKLVFNADQVNPDFAEMHNSGAFKKRSLALYSPEDPRNPKPGVWYPRHFGFLGAMPPAIKGLPATQFSEDDHPITIEFGEVDADGLVDALKGLFGRMRDLIIDKFGREEADRTIPDWEIDSIRNRVTADQPATSPEFSEESPMSADKQKEIEAREAKLKAREDKIAKDEAKRRRGGAVAFAEQLADKGRILPRQQPALVEVLLALPTESVEFAEGDETRQASPDKLFREFLESLPEAIEFGEKSADDLPDAPANFTLPPGCTADPEGLELMRKARAYQAQHSCEFSEAVDAVAITH